MLCAARLKLGTVLRLTVRTTLLATRMLVFFCLRVYIFFGSVDKGKVLDCVSNGLEVWVCLVDFRCADFEYHRGQKLAKLIIFGF